MSNPLLDLVEAHLGVDLRDPNKRNAKLDWIANGGPGRGAFLALDASYRAYVATSPLVATLPGAVFRPYISSELQDGLFDKGLGLSEYGHDADDSGRTFDLLRYLLLYCDGVVVDNPMRFFVDKAAMVDQPAMAATARQRMVTFLRLVAEYAELIESGALAFLEHDVGLHNHPHRLYPPGTAVDQRQGFMGHPPGRAATAADDASIVEGYMAGQLAAWKQHDFRFNIHAPGELGLRLLEDAASTDPSGARPTTGLRPHLQAVAHLVELGLPSVRSIKPSLLIALRNADELHQLRDVLHSTIRDVAGGPIAPLADELQRALADRIGHVIESKHNKGKFGKTRKVGFAAAGAFLGTALAGPFGTAPGAGLGAGAASLAEQLLEDRLRAAGPLGKLVVVLRSDGKRPEPPGRG